MILLRLLDLSERDRCRSIHEGHHVAVYWTCIFLSLIVIETLGLWLKRVAFPDILRVGYETARIMLLLFLSLVPQLRRASPLRLQRLVLTILYDRENLMLPP
jgi:hypothetical protein